MTTHPSPSLRTLAKLYGIETFYIDMRKRRQEASDESLLLVLRALGAHVQTVDDVPKALRARRDEIEQQLIEPVIVAWNGKLHEASRLPQRATLVLEDGTTADWPPRAPLPFGYHRLAVRRDGQSSEALLMSAPLKAHFPLSKNAWGVFAPVYSLHSKRSFGAGDLTDLETVIEWMQGLGGEVAATLPLLASFLEDPLEPSPYSPVSRVFWNEFYADPTRVPDFVSCSEAGRLVELKPKWTKLVDYRGTMAAKRHILEVMARWFFTATEGPRRSEFDRFVQADPEVIDYALFRAVADRQKMGWQSWPDRLRRGDIRIGDWDEEIQQYHLYAQWVVQDQLRHVAAKTREAGGLLYLDLPLGLHSSSYDAWRYPSLFVKGMSGGAPPDPVFTTGQNWAFPPMNPHVARTSRYAYAIKYIRNHLQYARLLRIDHVMGLHRLYWIPEGLSGDKGVYVRYPAEDMYAILCLESHRLGAGIVGENLGMVPPEVTRSMTRHNIRQLYVVQYETVVDSHRAKLRQPPAGCVASLNTHDMFPFQAFLEGIDIDDRVDLGFLSAKEAAAERKERVRVRKALGDLQKCLEFLARSEAGVVLVNLEDLWRETKPQNIPATTSERPNWRRRMRYSMDRLRTARQIQEALRKLNHDRKGTSSRQK
jgi:4-alpha-glucanotransferase